jgi:hypothetical protein
MSGISTHRRLREHDGMVDTCGTHALQGEDTGIDSVLSIHNGVPRTAENEETCNDDWVSGVAPSNACSGLDTSGTRDSALIYEIGEAETVFIRVSDYLGREDGRFLMNVGFVCAGDVEPDGDIDGEDLCYFASHLTSITVENFVANFGRPECP